MPNRSVVILCFEGVQLLDISGPAQALTTANAEGASPPYDVSFIGIPAGSVVTASGLPIVLTAPDLSHPIDTLIIPGGPGIETVSRDPQALAVVKALSRRARRVCSICTGARIAASAGLLDGRRAVTHWRSCKALAADFPKVCVETDPLFIRDGKMWTSAGVTSGIDLTLSLIEDDHSFALAARVAQRLVVYLRRTGGQKQFSEPLRAQISAAEPYQQLIEKIIARPDLDWTAERMAQAAGQSLRSFHRKFQQQTGASPGKTVEAIRCSVARSLFQTTDLTIDQVARKTGFNAASTLRRAFHRQFGVAPKFIG